MDVEQYKSFKIYYYFIPGDKGFADQEVYISDASRYSRNSIEEAKNDIDRIIQYRKGEIYDF